MNARPADSPKYATRLKEAMKTRLDKAGQPYSMRQLAAETDYSYEQIRKALTGEPVVSRELNAAICAVLGLPKNDMWTLALQDKLVRRFRSLVGLAREVPLPDEPSSPDLRLPLLLSRLTQAEKEKVAEFAEGVLGNRQEISAAPDDRTIIP
jgi:lambda repressor-like predicted transcriptional regulator